MHHVLTICGVHAYRRGAGQSGTDGGFERGAELFGIAGR